MPDVSVLNVKLYEETIGALVRNADDQTLFTFTQAYIENQERPTLSLSFKDSLGGLITDIRPTRVQASPFFSNLLPEGHLRDYLAGRAGVKGVREFFLLWVLGKDLPGAVTVESSDGERLPSELPGENEKPLPRDALRFSLAGVQLKFSAIMEMGGGLTIPAKGMNGSWIVKLPSPRLAGVPENEYSIMKLAKRIGMNVPDTQLVPMEKIENLPEDIGDFSGQALAVRRFDRSEGGGKLHIEDFAQVFGVYPAEKYEHVSYRNIAEKIWLETGQAAAEEFIRRLVFNTLIGNADMHLKNWSLIYPGRRNAELAPAYDFVSTLTYPGNQDLALGFAGSKKMQDMSRERFSVFAAKARLPEYLVLSTAEKTVESFMEAWAAEKKNLPLAGATRQAIDRHFPEIALVKEVRAGKK